jgi:hypothetical protein
VSRDLVFTHTAGHNELAVFPDCPRCGMAVVGTAIVAYESDDDKDAVGMVVDYVWCVPCFLVKCETWAAMADYLRGNRDALQEIKL